MSYTNSEILDALEYTSIGGGRPYTEYEGKLHPSEADIEVDSVEGLVDALNSSNEIIAIANDARLDMTGRERLDLGSKTLVSYRGWGDQDGALIYTNSRGYFGRRPYTLFRSNEAPRVTGLRIRGARHDEEFTRWDYNDNLARAIMLRGPDGEVDNCEIYGWPWNAVHVKGRGRAVFTDAEIHHNHIHKAYQIGYGYGVGIWTGFAHIHHNYFDEARHAVDGFGWWNTGYVVEDNVFGPRQYAHPVDMHCLEENSAAGRVGDDQAHPDYSLRAGGRMLIRNNTFCAGQSTRDGPINAITIRGVPWANVTITNNRFAHPERPPRNSGNRQAGYAWRQVNLNLRSFDEIPQNEEGYTEHWSDDANQFGAPDAEWSPAFGAPIDLKNPETTEPASRDPQLHAQTLSRRLDATGSALSNVPMLEEEEDEDICDQILEIFGEERNENVCDQILEIIS